LRETIARLNERLDEPFVTVNIVTGDKGIKTCASRKQTSLLDLLRRRQVYPTRRKTSTSASRIINHRKIKEKKMTWHKICIDFNDFSFQNMFI